MQYAGTDFLSIDRFVDLFNDESVRHIVYATGDVAYCAQYCGEMVMLRDRVQKLAEQKRGFLTQKRLPGKKMRCGAAFEYRFTKAREDA